MLLHNDIDIAIHYDVRNYPQNIETRELGIYPLVMVASPTLTEGQIDFITPNQHKSICHTQNDPNALYLKILTRYLKEKNIHLESELELWSIEAIKRSVMSNLGVAFLPRFTVEAELEQALLQEIKLDMEDPSMTAICAYSKNKRQSPAASLFLEILNTYFPNIPS